MCFDRKDDKLKRQQARQPGRSPIISFADTHVFLLAYRHMGRERQTHRSRQTEAEIRFV